MEGRGDCACANSLVQPLGAQHFYVGTQRIGKLLSLRCLAQQVPVPTTALHDKVRNATPSMVLYHATYVVLALRRELNSAPSIKAQDLMYMRS